MHGPTIIYDKSTIQALSPREAEWLAFQFHGVLTPTLYREVLADLKKTPREGRTPEQEVASLASKLSRHTITPSMHYRELIELELLHEPVEMSRRPYLGGGRRVEHSDGTVAMHFEESEAAVALRNWEEGQFAPLHQDMAVEWRESIQATNLAALRQQFGWVKSKLDHLKSSADVVKMVDAALTVEPDKILAQALNFFGIPDQHQRQVIARWQASGRPDFPSFAPYAAHCLRVDMIFMFCLARGFISDGRATHTIDFTYFYYLPFAYIFSSNDKLHREFAPFFLKDDQLYVPLPQLKAGLKELADYYDGLSEDTKRKGKFNYGHYPPVEGTFWAASMYDRFYGADWRIDATTLPPPRDPERDKAMIERFMKHMREAESS